MTYTDHVEPINETAATPDHLPETFDTTLDFGYLAPPLTANQRMHWHVKADITAGVRKMAGFKAHRIPYLGKCRVTLTWFVNTKHRRDADNVVPTLKAMCDGLVDAGIVTDDTPDLMVKVMPVITYDKTCEPHMELRIEMIA